MRTDTAQIIKLQDYSPPKYDISNVNLDVRLEAEETTVVADIDFCQNQNTPFGQALVLDGDELTLKSIALDGQILDPEAYIASPQQLIIKNPPTKPFKLTIKTQLNPKANTKLMGLYQSNGIYCTQCEAEGFRRITYFLDRPDVLATYTTKITADKATTPILLSNGNKVIEGDLENGKHYAIWHDPHPKPSYLFALVGGDLDGVNEQFITHSGRKVDLNIYVEKGKADRAGFAMWALKNSMRWDEENYGREYDLDVFNIVAVSDFNMGAMENKGLNIFNDQFILADPQTATDANYHLIDSIIAHEYFHNWTGNRITCRDWFQLCLKEGLTVFRDQEYSEDQGSKIVSRIQEVMTVKSAQFQEDAGPLAHSVRPNQYKEINNFYTATVYRKGAELIRMLKTILGRVGFFKGIQLYFDRHDGQAATIEQFITCFEDANDVTLSQFFLWYEQAGTPTVNVQQEYDEAQKTLTLRLSQSTKATPGQAVKKPFHIPLKFGLVGRDGSDMSFNVDGNCPVNGAIIHLTENEALLKFSKLKNRPVVSIGRDFSAPINIEIPQTLSEQKFLALYDSDLFNRWQSAQNILMEHLTNASKFEQAKIAPDLLELFYNLSQQAQLAPHYRATLLSLPSPHMIANAIGSNISPEKIVNAHSNLQKEFGKILLPKLVEMFKHLKIEGTYKPSAEQVGKRTLFATLLMFGCAAQDEYSLKLCQEKYYEANNMSTRISALNCYLQKGKDKEIRTQMLQHFYDSANDDPLLHDKWFSIQATDPNPDCLIDVITLMGHKAFDLNNPNRVRALIGSFVMNNLSAFHRKDGKGYEFLARIGIEIDRKNPQLAARLLTAFSTWKNLEPTRRGLAKSALETILEQKELSLDVQDIVGRTLAEQS